MADVTVDTTTQSNSHDIATEHVAFDWRVNFDAQILQGSATHTLKVKKDNVVEVMCVNLLFCSSILNKFSTFNQI
jgi:leukotriene-A4 hydrolase